MKNYRYGYETPAGTAWCGQETRKALNTNTPRLWYAEALKQGMPEDSNFFITLEIEEYDVKPKNSFLGIILTNEVVSEKRQLKIFERYNKPIVKSKKSKKTIVRVPIAKKRRTARKILGSRLKGGRR